MSEPRVVGIDVSKAELVVAIEGEPAVQMVPNDDPGWKRLCSELQHESVQLIVLEASGGYERELVERLWAAGLPVHRANPRQVRDFARSSGQLAKTDALDARVLVRFGRTLQLEAQRPPSPARRRLALLQSRRRALLGLQVSESNRAQQASDPVLQASIERMRAHLAEEQAVIEAEMDQLIAQCTELRHHAALLQSIPGIGVVTARLLLAGMPELGRATGKEIAALAGVAPFNQESGRWRGQAQIRAGRAKLRHGLYMCVVAAITHNAVLRSFYARLVAAGKPGLVAMTAVMRKLLVIANAMLRDGRSWQPPAWAQC